MLLNRYSFSRRVGDMSILFGMSESNVSVVCRGFESIVMNRIKWGFQFNTKQFRPENLEGLASAIYDKGAELPNIVGFIDGTMQAIARPSQDHEVQKVFYNGWKHLHALKYQSIVTPDGITSSLLGPYVGSRHDQYIYTMSKTEARVEKYLDIVPDVELPFALYGDPAYMFSKCLYSSFEGVSLSDLDKKINKSMSKVRVAIEWEFGEVQKYFKYSKYKYAMKTGETSPATVYMLSAVFKNMIHCTGRNRSPTSSYFGLEPPTLEEYISGLRRDKIDGEDEDDILF
ncbi:hypothetical protein PHYBLDRAFT_188753 [Phycomyces blakesleeanus NRRL 1555(-)]|uniref:DDE Tnp4 domain-containing protein n=1 Tax=Phycomyces blakesleeanus (strain ATCC 8743b / DSM 1359 / FGSC 10004 / NBRC 33097 / NRRL 1555) TaxID=763407 RepID=A0A162N4M6_PHYB8|nr:hypothetical protein PHYBLDRAFT_188753 [Phycomyces blakesleeanus NRRL 1555(-)]OAD68488.1 hypothetical protein PHYBLDRAFT_188753 [Phycomyces blakesleeanus NRRL 1555(-)]|eukprot:XP_018286528.1 hypothetical protein PHYBLDRAFT_188753 [Phycomyces blakesleeanus NRRL 1555(-)]